MSARERRTIDNLRKRFRPSDVCPRWERFAEWGQPLAPDAVRLKPGTVGRRVRAGRDAFGRIVGAAVPPLPTLAQLRRESPALCEPAYEVELDNGRRVVVPGPRLRELNRRPRGGLCPEGYASHALDVYRTIAEAEAAASRGEVAHPAERLEGLPFAHRRASSPCCGESEHTTRRTREALRQWREGEGYDDATPADMLALVRATVPRSVGVKVKTLDDADAALRAVDDHCLSLWREWLERAAVGRKAKLREVKAAVRAKVPKAKRRR